MRDGRKSCWVAVAVLALLVMIAFMTIQGRKQPVTYPAEWPLAYAAVPRGATAGEIPFRAESMQGRSTWVSPWRPLDSDPDNMTRATVVGFRYGGSFEQAFTELEITLGQHDWLWDSSYSSRLKDNETRVYWSDDFQYKIYLTKQHRILTLKEYQPERWSLAVHEYKVPLDEPDGNPALVPLVSGTD